MKEIRIPLSWQDITIAQYQEICNIDDELSASDKRIEQLSILTDTDSEQIKSLPLSDLFKLIEMVKFVDTTAIDSFVNKTFEFNGIKYGVLDDFNKVTGYEWFDNENWKLDPINNMHNYAAMAYRPIIKEDEEGNYVIKDYKDDKGFSARAEAFKNLPITYVNGFFLRCALFQIEFTMIMAGSSTESKEVTKKRRTQKKTGKKIATQTPIKRNKKRTSKDTTCGMTSSQALSMETQLKSKS